MTARAAHRVEDATPDRDKNFLSHSRESGSECRALRSLCLKSIHLTRLSGKRILVSLQQRLPKRHQLPALSAPKRENASDFHRSIRRQSDSVVLPATSTLRLPSSVNATTACSGCSVRRPSALVLVVLR